MYSAECYKSSPIFNAPKRHVEDEPEMHVLTHEELNEQIRPRRSADQTTRGLDAVDSGDDDRSTSYLLP